MNSPKIHNPWPAYIEHYKSIVTMYRELGNQEHLNYYLKQTQMAVSRAKIWDICAELSRPLNEKWGYR